MFPFWEQAARPAAGTVRRDRASSLTPLASERSGANAAPENLFTHHGLGRVGALPSCATVPHKPMCRQTLADVTVPRPSILPPLFLLRFRNFRAQGPFVDI